ncbi:MAG: acyl-CoA dehydratase activase [Clostridiales bacterium]|nr:acyl-CoA dehydratase activase [Clostridiales bacterium]
MSTKENVILVGIDVGSTTTKVVAVKQGSHERLLSDYRRHHSKQLESVIYALEMAMERFPEEEMQVVITGSGAKPLATAMEIPYIQEVVAHAGALKEKYQDVGTAIELGGQDAKIIFFSKNKQTGELEVADMRMNGSCAGGTGAFLDEVAKILKIPVEEMNALAKQGTSVYDISGRCGVYAKTDIQPLLNQGIEKKDLALSSLHAIAKQTIGGLAQGLTITKPVAFEGGPMTFIPTLIRVFAERLNLTKEDIIIPEQPETIVAYGAAISLETLFEEQGSIDREALRARIEELKKTGVKMEDETGKPWFSSDEEKRQFEERHKMMEVLPRELKAGETVNAYLGIDSGSTTTKFVFMNEDEEILDTFYSSNEGDPLAVVTAALKKVRDRYRAAGAKLNILSTCTTGYGEMLLYKAFSADTHVVETVAHARAINKYVPDATFILDIGGQDMKAIWLEDGIITNILVNEACSSGCGSFLENFASTLNIQTKQIATKAFAAKNPAVLGSRCTVFMNSSIVTAQRSGKQPDDIMAGLCRSIIENVFTKVIRVSNIDSLGNRIVVQGGTFQNDAVLCAMEQYIGKEVTRAPYPGIMGAIGAALIAKEQYNGGEGQRSKSQQSKGQQGKDQQAKGQQDATRKNSTFISLDDLDDFSYRQEANVPCPFCGNHCKRVIMTFSNGNTWVTNNRCERGEIIGDLQSEEVKKQLKETSARMGKTPDLFKLREKLLFKKYPINHPSEDRNVTIGIPRVLYFWDDMPFWTTFWKTLGFQVKISDSSTRKMYDSWLSAITSDTVCFPAKLVHGHVRNLVSKGVDRIFYPSITTRPTENTEKTSESMCAVVKGYPIVLKNSDNPETQWGIPLDAPLFHWFKEEDKKKQLVQYIEETFEIPAHETEHAVEEGNKALASFHKELLAAGQAVLDETEKRATYAVVLASRPYQNDALVNHELPEMFTNLGIPVLTVDSVPGTDKVDLSQSRLDVVNNYHARMLSTAILSAEKKNLEYVQIVSFGCGHDAYLSDEIIRLTREISNKTPLILKVDESDIHSPLLIRVRSFVETVNSKRKRHEKETIHALSDPYEVKYDKQDIKERVVLVPNTSHAFCRIMSAGLSRQGVRAVPLEMGREEAIRLGKKYVHNDICFPAQIVIGEALAALETGKYDLDHVAIGMAKYIGDCRLTHYGALLRKALDDAGYEQVPILTNDDEDYHDLHPGYHMNLMSALCIAVAMPMIDVLEELLRKMRPYEIVEGSANRAFDEALDVLVEGMEKHGVHGAIQAFKKSIAIVKTVEYDRSERRPEVLIIGEYLLNFHPGANHDIEDYLERNGFEIIEARMTDVIRKTYFARDTQIREFKLKKDLPQKVWNRVANQAFEWAHDVTDRIAKDHPLYKRACRLPELAKKSDGVIHHTFDAGEGILIPGEIIHHADEGCENFVVLQPFGCLPNHIVSRGVIKKLKELYPDIQILPLDYDPDVSFANVENRLQMLVMNMKSKKMEKEHKKAV